MASSITSSAPTPVAGGSDVGARSPSAIWRAIALRSSRTFPGHGSRSHLRTISGSGPLASPPSVVHEWRARSAMSARGVLSPRNALMRALEGTRPRVSAHLAPIRERPDPASPRSEIARILAIRHLPFGSEREAAQPVVRPENSVSTSALRFRRTCFIRGELHVALPFYVRIRHRRPPRQAL